MNYYDIEYLCAKYVSGKFFINHLLMVDIEGDIDMRFLDISELPMKFNKVTGNFNCSYSNLTTLEGCPKYVGGNFNCYSNKLTVLDYYPKYVGKTFNCNQNKLTTLHGVSFEVKQGFYCYKNNFKVRQLVPDITGEINSTILWKF